MNPLITLESWRQSCVFHCNSVIECSQNPKVECDFFGSLKKQKEGRVPTTLNGSWGSGLGCKSITGGLSPDRYHFTCENPLCTFVGGEPNDNHNNKCISNPKNVENLRPRAFSYFLLPTADLPMIMDMLIHTPFALGRHDKSVSPAFTWTYL